MGATKTDEPVDALFQSLEESWLALDRLGRAGIKSIAEDDPRHALVARSASLAGRRPERRGNVAVRHKLVKVGDIHLPIRLTGGSPLKAAQDIARRFQELIEKTPEEVRWFLEHWAANASATKGFWSVDLREDRKRTVGILRQLGYAADDLESQISGEGKILPVKSWDELIGSNADADQRIRVRFAKKERKRLERSGIRWALTMMYIALP